MGSPERRGERGETLPLLIIWPVLLVAIILLAVHAFIVGNAQAEASVAASKGLRAAWRAAAESDLSALDLTAPDLVPEGPTLADGALPRLSPEVVHMSDAARTAVAVSAASDPQSWRWWSNEVVQVQSDWCSTVGADRPAPAGVVRRPGRGDAGWVRVVVSGEVLGPLAALWPGRFDTVHATAEGPARFVSNPDEDLAGFRGAPLPSCP